MISIANSNDFSISPFQLRSSLSIRNAPATPSSIRRQASLPSLSPTTRASIEVIPNSAASCLDLISRVREGLLYHSPELCEEGVNGTYFLKDKNGKKIAVFKPQDEEGNSDNNPKRSPDDNLSNKGILPGEAAVREVAAYLLDREHFYGVPRTLMVKITHTFDNAPGNYSEKLTTKIGSLQEFIDNDGSSEDFGPKAFPVAEVQKIAILDIQIFNLDRHAGNILVRKTRSGTVNLVPIDQGFSLPDVPELHWFEWMNWPQAKVPLNDDAKDYILRMDPTRDIRILRRELGIRPECLKNMQLSVALLKKAVELNLTLYDLGMIICRRNPAEASIYELICENAAIRVETQLKQELKNELSNSNDEVYQRLPLNAEELFIDIVTKSLDIEIAKQKQKQQESKNSNVFVKRV